MGNIIEITKKIKIVNRDTLLEKSECLSKEIDKYWKETLQEKDFLYNGPVYSVSEVQDTDYEMIFNLVETDYAHYIYSKSHRSIPLCECCRTFAVGSLIRSADDKIILGISGKYTEIEGIVQFIGGGIDQQDIIGHEFVAKRTALRELEEEVGETIVHAIETIEEKYLHISEREDYYGLLFEAVSSMRADHIVKSFMEFKKLSARNEIDELVILKCTEESIAEFIASNLYKRPSAMNEILKKYVNVIN